jgi:hypothetical protein
VSGPAGDHEEEIAWTLGVADLVLDHLKQVVFRQIAEGGEVDFALVLRLRDRPGTSGPYWRFARSMEDLLDLADFLEAARLEAATMEMAPGHRELPTVEITGDSDDH